MCNIVWLPDMSHRLNILWLPYQYRWQCIHLTTISDCYIYETDQYMHLTVWLSYLPNWVKVFTMPYLRHWLNIVELPYLSHWVNIIRQPYLLHWVNTVGLSYLPHGQVKTVRLLYLPHRLTVDWHIYPTDLILFDCHIYPTDLILIAISTPLT